MTPDPADHGTSDSRYCSWCAGRLATEERHGHSRLVCSQCQRVHYRNPAVGVAVLIRDGGRILLGRRARGAYAGKWCIPCGYIEWGEEVRDAASREFREETGLEVSVGEVVAVHSNFHDAEQLTVGIWFAGSIVGGDLRADDDLDAVEFFALEHLPELAFPTDARVLSELPTKASDANTHNQPREGTSRRR